MADCMPCKVCGAAMRLDDRDYNFKGNYDNYWVCDHCNTTCFEKVRYGKSVSEEWVNNDRLLEYSDLYVYGMPLFIWNSLSESEQINLTNKYEYELMHPDCKEWGID